MYNFQALEMIGNLRAAFTDLLEENDWMDPDTREVAREKVNWGCFKGGRLGLFKVG